MENILSAVKANIQKVLVGEERVTSLLLTALVVGGHVLIEDMPGLGKTTLASALASSLGCTFKRIQFTPDVLPSDITGFTMFNLKTGEQELHLGSIMNQIVLADEINRTSPKTQSALLEVMEEGRITVDGVTRETPKPYTVIATQNPVGSAGTQLLPESQMDRFMVCLRMGYPKLEDEVEILRRKQGGDPLEQVQKVVDAQGILAMQHEVENVYLADSLYGYIARLTSATRKDPMIRLGASPRGSIALTRMAQAAAYLSGRDYVIPRDVQIVFHDVIGHRIVLSPQAKMGDVTAAALLEKILNRVDAPSVK